MVFAALQQRHMRERVELEELFNNEVDSARAFAKAHAEESRQLERDSLLGKQDQVSTSYFFVSYLLKHPMCNSLLFAVLQGDFFMI